MSTLLELDRATGAWRPRQADDVPILDAGAWQAQPDVGLLLGVDAEPEARFAAARLVVVDFPAFHDGRGLSLAVLLRSRTGFTGELRAAGDVHPELLHYLARCGFDSALLPPGRSIAPGDGLLAPHADYYQASVAEAHPAFRRGRRGVYLRDH